MSALIWASVRPLAFWSATKAVTPSRTASQTLAQLLLPQ